MFLAGSAHWYWFVCYLIDSFLCLRGLPGSPGGESLFFASPKKSNQKKGDPQSGPRCGSLKKLKEPENLETSQLRCRRTSKFFNPAPLTFSSPARTGWEGEHKVGCGGSPHPSPLPKGEGGKPKSFDALCRYPLSLWARGRVRASPNPHLPPHPVPAGLSSAGGSGNKFLDVRRRRSRLVSKNSADPEQRKLPEAKRRDPDCGSPFLLLTLLLAKQKKSELPPGNPGTPRKASQINQSAI